MNFFFYFLLPLSYQIEINFIGQLFLAQPLFIFSSIYFFFQKNLQLTKLQKRIIIMIFASFFIQLISNFYNDVSFTKNIKGISKIIFFGLSLYTFFILTKINEKKIINFIIFLSTFNIINSLFFSENSFEIDWKLNSVALSFTLLSLIILTNFFKFKILISILILLISVVSLFLGSRIFFGINLFNFILIIFYIKKNEKFDIKHNFLKKVLGIILIIYSIFFSYNYLFKKNMLPEKLQNKQIAQSYENRNILFGGRNEIISSLSAINKKPILGYGSWPENCELRFLYFNLLSEYNFKTNDLDLFMDSCLIASHSYLFQAWVEYGIFGFFFWLYLLYLIFKLLMNSSYDNVSFFPLKIFTALFLIWTILFSPFGSYGSIYIPYLYIIMFLQQKKNVDI